MIGTPARHKSEEPKLSARYLGQLLLMQSVVVNLPDEKSIFSFVCHGLRDTPGVESVHFSEVVPEVKPSSLVVLPLSTGASPIGALLLHVSDFEAFAPYQYYLTNYAFMLTVILNERRARQEEHLYQYRLESDVKERTKELQQQINERVRAEARFRLLVEQAPDAILLFDFDLDRFVEVNGSAIRLFHRTRDELLRAAVDNICPLIKKESVRILSGDVLTFEQTVRGDGGREAICEARLSRLPFTGRKLARVSYVDITERKYGEKALLEAKSAAEQVARIRSQFLDIAAHELRTPVTAIGLLLQFSQRQLSQGVPVSGKTLARLTKQSDRLSRLVLDLLDVSRLERGSMELHRVRTDIVSILSECIEQFQMQFSDRSFVFFKQECPIELCLDPVRINQVISNLIDNAVKYSPAQTPVELTIQATADRVRISVIDHGVGLSDEQKGELFRPLTHRSSDLVAHEGGLGLGLFVSRKIIELHGGTIGVTSKPGLGSKFYFELPRKSAQ